MPNNATQPVSFGAWLGQMMAKRGLTQTQLGDAVGVSQQTISGYLNDESRPRSRWVNPLAQALGVTAADVLAAIELSPTVPPEGGREHRRQELLAMRDELDRALRELDEDEGAEG